MVQETPTRGTSYWPILKRQGGSYYEEYLRRLNRNQTERDISMISGKGIHIFGEKKEEDKEEEEEEEEEPTLYIEPLWKIHVRNVSSRGRQKRRNRRVWEEEEREEGDGDGEGEREERRESPLMRALRQTRSSEEKPDKSEHFSVVRDCNVTFADIGGYDLVKEEMGQCIDILLNYSKYAGYNVRIPKGLILEGPPGNGKTLLAKGFAGTTKTAFIPVSGSEFQDKYIGVGSSRVRELFDLARKNRPCVVFIDEIDAVGRKRSGDGEGSTSERDNTLNELLIGLDGFVSSSGVFLIGATNRADLLDPALIRPGRIDKRIFIGLPDAKTREAILGIHLRGKPYDAAAIRLEDLVELTVGLSGAQIENVLNEAMLYALRQNRSQMQMEDIDMVLSKMLLGWQPTEHQLTEDMVDRIAVHEMGHAIVGFLSKHHAKVTKVSINLSSPNAPGSTIFEGTTTTIYTKESLFEHLMILLAGRVAEEELYGVSTTTGASMDFDQAYQLAKRMVMDYGMGRGPVIYPQGSDRYKELVDDEVFHLINSAHELTKSVVNEYRNCVRIGADFLKKERILKGDRLKVIMEQCRTGTESSADDYPLVP